MQSLTSIGRSIYRIVFLGGSPQRIQYSNRRMAVSILLFIALAAATQRYLFFNDFIAIGLFLFTCLTGIYIASALLTRKVTRPRLRISLLAVWMILAASQLLLLLYTCQMAE